MAFVIQFASVLLSLGVLAALTLVRAGTRGKLLFWAVGAALCGVWLTIAGLAILAVRQIGALVAGLVTHSS